MKPYFQEGGITIYHGDCREILLEIAAVDVVIADPPYGETSLEWDQTVRGWMDTCESVTSSLWCFGSLQMFMEMARTGECSRWIRSQEIIWEKHNGSNFHADRFKRVHELVAHFYRGEWSNVFKAPVLTNDSTARTIRRKGRPPHTGEIGKAYYRSYDGGPRLMRSVITVQSCHGEAEHPTQKPIGIIDPLLRYSCPPGGMALDPFMGIGSSLVAAKKLGLHAIGIEIEERYCAIAAKRLQQQVFDFSVASTEPTPETAALWEIGDEGDSTAEGETATK